jgi:hypothetical protein
MSRAEIKAQLEQAVASEQPLEAIVDRLRASRDRGASRVEVQGILEEMRSQAPSEEIEDRILETLDFVTGFCSPHMKIWND